MFCSGARGEVIHADQVAEEALVGGQGLRHGPGRAVEQVLDVSGVGEVSRGGAAEGAGEDRQGHLAGQAVVGEAYSRVPLAWLIAQVVLRVLKFAAGIRSRRYSTSLML